MTLGLHGWTSFPLRNVESMDWGDFDGDGDLDAALSGQDTIGN